MLLCFCRPEGPLGTGAAPKLRRTGKRALPEPVLLPALSPAAASPTKRLCLPSTLPASSLSRHCPLSPGLGISGAAFALPQRTVTKHPGSFCLGRKREGDSTWMQESFIVPRGAGQTLRESSRQDPEMLVVTCCGKQRDLLQSIASHSR